MPACAIRATCGCGASGYEMIGDGDAWRIRQTPRLLARCVRPRLLAVRVPRRLDPSTRTRALRQGALVKGVRPFITTASQCLFETLFLVSDRHNRSRGTTMAML